MSRAMRAWGNLAVTVALVGRAAAGAAAAPDGAAGTGADTAAAGARGDSLLAALIAEAAEANPGLEAARESAEAAESGRRRALAARPPEVGVEFMQMPLSTANPARAGEIDYSVRQMFMFPGKRGAMAEAEGYRAEMAKEELRAARDRLRREVTTTFFDLYWIDRQLGINRENRHLVRHFQAMAARQYEAGLGRQADILRAQTELATLESEGRSLEQERHGMEGMLDALLGRAPGTPAPAIAPLDPAPLADSLPALLARQEARRPDLKAMRAEAGMRRAEGAAARREYWPDLMAGLKYQDMRGAKDAMTGAAAKDGWALMLSMEVPLAPWSAPGYREGYRAAALGAGQAEARYRDMRNMAAAELQDAYYRARSAWNRITLSRANLIPLSGQALQSALAAYEAGKADFLTLLDAHHMALMAKRDYHMQIMRYGQALADLDRAVGAADAAAPSGGGG